MKSRKPEILATAPSFLWLALFVFVPFAIIFTIAFRPALPAGGIGEGWSLDAIVFIPMLGSYVIPDMVGGTDSQMLGNKIVQRNFNDRNLPQAAALSCALTLLVLAPMLLKRKEKPA